ncbi:unnamed protein product [Rotaria magnacalcarata]
MHPSFLLFSRSIFEETIWLFIRDVNQTNRRRQLHIFSPGYLVDRRSNMRAFFATRFLSCQERFRQSL